MSEIRTDARRPPQTGGNCPNFAALGRVAPPRIRGAVALLVAGTLLAGPEVPALMFIKLIVHPLLILLLLSIMGDFPPAWVFAGMVMAALPPALNIFVISTQYGVGVERASASILVGTIASMVTLTLFLWLIREGYMPHDLFPSR
jgi:hypothetical protein